MRIVHLTDLHLSKENIDPLKQTLLNPFLTDLRKWSKPTPVDLVLLTGDLVDKGGASFQTNEDYYAEIETLYIDKICDVLSISKDRFIFIPGNHDVCEGKIDDISESGILQFKDIARINRYVGDYKSDFHSGIERLKEYKKFEARFHSNTQNKYISNFESCYVVDINGEPVGIAALNSAWRCSTKLPKENLLFGTRQISDAIEFFNNNRTVFNIALIHHPIELISDIERRELQALLHAHNFNILLSGHTHSGEIIHSLGTHNKLFTSVAKTAFSNPRERIDEFKPGYTVLDLDRHVPGEVTVKCNFRKYIHSRLEFDKDVDISENGEYTSVVKTNANEVFNRYLNLTGKTFVAKQDIINTSLVTHGTDSIAPRSLDDIFVMPKLTEKPVIINDIDEDPKLISLDELLTIEKNILLIGDKETGKSTLLNKIFSEASHSFARYQVIPIKFEFSDLKDRDIRPLVKNFLNDLQNEEIDQMFLDGKFLILLDNYVEGDEYFHAKNRLRKFVEDYSGNKVIVTTSTQIDNLITTEHDMFARRSEDDGQKEFKPFFIGSVGVKEFKGLAIKWFKRRDSQWIQDNLEKLIKVFEILRIPRTFFSVSLFLWIIEKQENFKPVNKSNLVSQFLTFILEGLKIENAQAGSYNFEKKIELLMELSLHMYRNGSADNNYSISETDAIRCFQNNFDLNQQKRFSAADKIHELIEKGILKRVNESNQVRFRYDAFFKYFLSLNIEKDDVFRAEVYSEEKFLSFIDELDYHTGRRRDDVASLEFVMQKLQEAYIDVDSFIGENVDEYIPNESFVLKHVNPTTFIDNTRADKLTDEEVEEALGSQLEMLPVDDSIRVKKDVDYKAKFYRVLELASRVLKNSENIKKPEYVNESLSVIIQRAAKYGIYLQSIIAHNVSNNKEDELPLPPELFVVLAPIINQTMLLNWLGTDFLETPLENKLSSLLRQEKASMSQYELYLTGFIYSDLKLKGHIDYLERVIDKVDNKFILELCFLKIILYYMFRPSKSPLLPIYEKMMAVILMKSRDVNRKAAKKYVEQVLRVKRQEVSSQMKLDFN